MLRSVAMLSDPFAAGLNRSILETVLFVRLSVTELFGCSEREYQRGDEIAWYADEEQ